MGEAASNHVAYAEYCRQAALRESEMLGAFEDDIHEGIPGAQTGHSADELADINDLGTFDTPETK